MSGKQKECGYSWTSEGEIHTCSLPEGHTAAHICGFVFNPSDCCLERAEPTPHEGEAVPKQAFCAGCGGLLPVGHAEIYQPSTGKRYHARCEHLAAPVVSTAAPEPPLRISFDIGGVLSKYPEVFRPMVDALQKGGAEVFVITDMHEHDKSVRFVRGNGYAIPSERILNSDYTAHGEACKAETIRQHGINIHLDDFAGYCAHTECVSLFVWPNPLKPYYADDFKTDGTEGDFGRRKAAKI